MNEEYYGPMFDRAKRRVEAARASSPPAPSNPVGSAVHPVDFERRLSALEERESTRKATLQDRLTDLQSRRWCLLAHNRTAESHNLLPAIEELERELGLEPTSAPANVVAEQSADAPAMDAEVRRIAKLVGANLSDD